MGKASRRALVGLWIQQAKLKQEASLPPPPDKVEDPASSAGQRTISISTDEEILRAREKAVNDAAAKAARDAELAASIQEQNRQDDMTRQQSLYEANAVADLRGGEGSFSTRGRKRRSSAAAIETQLVDPETGDPLPPTGAAPQDGGILDSLPFSIADLTDPLGNVMGIPTPVVWVGAYFAWRRWG